VRDRQAEKQVYLCLRIREMTKRVPEMESEILQYPRAAFLYARDIIKGRWTELEKKEGAKLKQRYWQYFNWVQRIETEVDTWDSEEEDWESSDT